MKKLLAPFLILGLLTLSIPLSVSAETTFTDLESDDPSKTAIEWMKTNGIVEGYPDGSFQSTNPINRAEFMKIVVESMTDEATGSSCFTDVADEWFAKYVCHGKTLGLVSGYPDGSFQPANEINFAEASKIITKALDITGAEISSDDPWYREYVEPLGELSAIPTSISDLDKSIARGEMAEVIWRVEEGQTELDSLKYEELEGEPILLNSCQEMKDLFLSNPPEYDYEMYEEEDSSSADVSSSESASSSVASDDYSTTNVQVEGVDESDIVKNDGEYIYFLQGSEVEIVQAVPAESMTRASTITFDEDSFYPTTLYLDGDQLVVIGYQYEYSTYEYDEAFDQMISPSYHSSKTVMYVYDVSDRNAPELSRKLQFDGDYNSSRKIDDTVYLVLNKYDFSYYGYGYDPEALNVEEVLPRYYDSATGEETQLVDCTDIRYLPRERDLNYVMALAIPLTSEDSTIDREVLIGSSENIYASTGNLYIASTNYDSDDYYYDWTNAKTLVHRFALSNGHVSYEASGKVQGTILNQFSMDEHEDHFRIATTKGHAWDTEIPSTNNLYVLDQDLDTVGSVENLAPGETIYSTRFMGDRGYMVTFKKVDPLFVFDLSDPTNPTNLGELKIPGYSEYLHPYDENHILGFGKDAEDASEEETATRDLDFAWYQGIKVSLFDVTDPANPTQLFSVGIGDRGTGSPLLYDHHALLFSASRGLLAFPVSVAEVTDENADANTYGDTVFQGAYVYHLDLENGFNLQATPSHYNSAFDDSSSYWESYNSYREIDRVIYIGDTLFTVSAGMVKAFDLSTFEEVGSIDVDLEDAPDYDNYIYE